MICIIDMNNKTYITCTIIIIVLIYIINIIIIMIDIINISNIFNIIGRYHGWNIIGRGAVVYLEMSS